MKTPRKCSRFYCDAMRERICCTDCPRAYRCPDRCLNHPNRCRLLDERSVIKDIKEK